ncbi:MAG: hypothetical protein QOH28_2642 [Actinomycetota bacterium]|jgi:hypothetical protein|nr:hypothetical protein [Actinomycetota bacterium]
MNDLSAAFAEAAYQPSDGPDMSAARQRGRRRQRRRRGRVAATLFALVAAATFTVTRFDERGPRPAVRIATSHDRWQTFTSRTGDVQIEYPPDWNVAPAVLTPHLSDPHEVLALGTFTMAPADHNCAHIPVNALEQMSPTDAFIWITERTGTDNDPAWNFGPRPASIDPTSGTDANGGDLAACLNRPLLGTERAVSFDDHSRHFTITYAIGTDATQQRRADVLVILNSFHVN